MLNKANLRVFMMILLALLSSSILNGNITNGRGKVSANICRDNSHLDISAPQRLSISGLESPAIVSGSISIAVSGTNKSAYVVYCLDEKPIGTAHEPIWGLGELNSFGAPVYSVRAVGPGEHSIYAISTTPDDHHIKSQVIEFKVIQDVNRSFSEGLAPFPQLPSLQTPINEIVKSVDTPNAGLTQNEESLRMQIAAMYLNFGFNIAEDYSVDISEKLSQYSPKGWLPAPKNYLSPPSLWFSGDAPFYHAIPASWPRTKLDAGFIKVVQLNTNWKGDQLGYGESISGSDGQDMTIQSMWYDQTSTRRDIKFKIAADWQKVIPKLTSGDQHVIFLDPKAGKFVSLYKTSADTVSGAPRALYASNPISFNSLGDIGGSTASRFAELPLLIQPGEATADNQEIRHAIGGSIRRVWAARVYPATARDYGVLSSANSCTGKGKTNTGVVPYGGIIQLDPSLDLNRLRLSRPAYRILKAMQVYGYYVMDFGCADLDIYTAISEDELGPYGGVYGVPNIGIGVEKEIAKIITTHDLYVVPPVTKRP